MGNLISLKIRMNRSLVERLDDVSRERGIARDEIVFQAVEKELRRLEIEKVKEEITEIEIGKNILADGQSLNVPLSDDQSTPIRMGVNCDLCMKEMKPPHTQFEGPFFCADCMEMAKGGDFSKLDQ